MKKQLLFLMFIFGWINIHAQTNVLWEKVNSVSVKKTESLSNQDKLYYKLNENLLTQKIAASTSKSATSEITIPNAGGVLERFMIWESSNFDPELQARYPEIRAYEGTGLDDKTAKIHFSVAPIGVQTMVLRTDKASEFIEQNPENKSEYVLFTSKNKDTSKSLLACMTKENNANKGSSAKTAKTTSNTQSFKTLRLAISCTGEYAAFFGGTKAGALAGMNATMTRVNGVFNRDLAVQLTLIANNDDVIYTDAVTDPYSNAPTGVNGAWNLQVQQTLTTVLGSSAYDIGHLFGGSGGGGDAGCIGCICVDPASSTDQNAKGSAFTSPSNSIPQGDTFDIDFVAHEMGHQLGGTHTFSYAVEGTGVNVEPGSGSTIMAYAGVTGDYDIQNNSDDYFAYASISQIQDNLATKTCPVSTVVINNPPTINAGLDYTIPFNTPFVLTGTGTDSEGDSITYCWEQNDSATDATKGSNSIAYPAKPDGPLFRSLLPTSSPIRYMPSLSTVLQNRLTTTWESVSSVARTLHFSLTGRDNAALLTPQTNTDNMIVTVNPAIGPFAVTSQNTNDIGWQKGSFQTITWAVNNTNTLSGSGSVNIKLSIDGGLTFPVVLASATPNDGSETITVPLDITATNCRILIEPTANIYYALNSNSFAVGYTVQSTCDTYSFGSAFAIPFQTEFVSKTVTVPASTGIISDVNVSVNVTHDRFSDLEIQIVSPQGTVVKLYDQNCDIVNSTLSLGYDDSGVTLDCSKTTSQIVLPIEALSAFNGQNPQGNWIFKVRDAVSGNFGTINSASVNICSQTFTLDNSEFEGVDFAMSPNPNKGNFNVQFECDSTKTVEVFVHDISGRKVYDKTYDKSPYFNQNIQLSKTSLGLYFVTIINGDKRIVKKILVN
ncbi:zinc-dependent metalloprotease [Flavobacterium sp. CF136]|uniref:zinc-dependent metalloprotease n=1 Tax=Flavobacterium sp. (strain CF136) TaxID=1144313 RepID=UPI0002718DFC|nr:zinc-dependent metalloprotease family protein [Flavobacterium sp. CF136]EJL63826.1 Por secretion system C-terminal sorting domain-containing protein [Flavobacterium sp. CF136]